MGLHWFFSIAERVASMSDPDQASRLESTRTQQLIVRCQHGEDSALAELMRRYFPRIARIVRIRMGRRLLERTTPDDIVQDVLVRMLKSIRVFETRSDGSFVAWLSTLVNNEINSQAARIRRPGAVDPYLPVQVGSAAASPSQVSAPSEGVSTKAAKAELTQLVDLEVAELAENHRDVILLRDYAGCDWKSVAEIMREKNPGATVGSCQELYSRACAKLAIAMKRYDVT